jgi:hypothetical protein
MSPKAIRYGELHDYLISLGYHRQAAPTHVVYRKPGETLPVILPMTGKTEVVPLSHLIAVERILELDGVVEKGQFAYSIGRAAVQRTVAKAKKSRARAPEDPMLAPVAGAVETSPPAVAAGAAANRSTRSRDEFLAIEGRVTRPSSVKTKRAATLKRAVTEKTSKAKSG